MNDHIIKSTINLKLRKTAETGAKNAMEMKEQ